MRTLHKFGIDIVRGCQLRCVGCPISTLKPKIEFIEPGDFLKILHNVDVGEVDLLRLFNFGEPLLHPEVVHLIKLIKQAPWKPKEVEISTNAQVLRKDDLKALVRGRIVTRLAVSCHGNGTPEEYEAWHTPAKWDKLMEFLEYVGKLRRKYNPRLELVTRTICTSVNGKRRWKKLVNPLGWRPLFRGKWELPEAKEYEKPRKIPTGKCLFVGKRKGRRLYVDIDGTVVPCCHHPRALVLGNLLEGTYVQMRKSQWYKDEVNRLSDRHSVPLCNGCDRP